MVETLVNGETEMYRAAMTDFPWAKNDRAGIVTVTSCPQVLYSADSVTRDQLDDKGS